MRQAIRYDHDEIRRLRAQGLSITDIQKAVGCSTGLVSMVARLEPTAEHVAKFRPVRLLQHSVEELESLLGFHRSLVASLEGELARRATLPMTIEMATGSLMTCSGCGREFTPSYQQRRRKRDYNQRNLYCSRECTNGAKLGNHRSPGQFTGREVLG